MASYFCLPLSSFPVLPFPSLFLYPFPSFSFIVFLSASLFSSFFFLFSHKQGKLRNEPVYALLGGKTKDRLPVYCTSARPDLSKEMGFVGAKVPCPYGPRYWREMKHEEEWKEQWRKNGKSRKERFGEHR